MALERTLPEPPPLRELTHKPLALFLDFDGTLVDIAPTPDSIAVPSGLSSLLARLANALSGRLAIVSGRSLVDIHKHLGELRFARSGSHGAERVDGSGVAIGAPPLPLPAEAREALRAFARSRETMIFEDKPFGAALHFRERPELEEESVAHATSIADDAGLAIKRGSCVVEVLHPGADKAGAVRAFMEQPLFAEATPVFVGDDITDEDGFRAAAELGGFGILVGNRAPTAAKFRLDTPDSVRRWLSV